VAVALARAAGLRRTVVERHPNLTEQPRLEYHQRILDLVAGRRKAIARQPQTQPARRQQQGRGLEIER
jgi:hypothetical protein